MGFTTSPESANIKIIKIKTFRILYVNIKKWPYLYSISLLYVVNSPRICSSESPDLLEFSFYHRMFTYKRAKEDPRDVDEENPPPPVNHLQGDPKHQLDHTQHQVMSSLIKSYQLSLGHTMQQFSEYLTNKQYHAIKITLIIKYVYIIPSIEAFDWNIPSKN